MGELVSLNLFSWMRINMLPPSSWGNLISCIFYTGLWRSVVHLRFVGPSVECLLLSILRPFSVNPTKRVSCAYFATRRGIKGLTPILRQSDSSLSFNYLPLLHQRKYVLVFCLSTTTLSGRAIATREIFDFLVSTPLFRGGVMTVAYKPWDF